MTGIFCCDMSFCYILRFILMWYLYLLCWKYFSTTLSLESYKVISKIPIPTYKSVWCMYIRPKPGWILTMIKIHVVWQVRSRKLHLQVQEMLVLLSVLDLAHAHMHWCMWKNVFKKIQTRTREKKNWYVRQKKEKLFGCTRPTDPMFEADPNRFYLICSKFTTKKTQNLHRKDEKML